MPRHYATIQCSIWDDPDFIALPAEAQATYFMLVTQSDIEACGALPLTLRRWSKYVAGGEVRRLTQWLNFLSSARFIMLDKDTEELLVRTFAKYDGGYKHAVRVKAVVASAEAIRSPFLREAIGAELAVLGVSTRIPVPQPSLPGGTAVPVESLSSATPEAVESQRSVVTKGEYRSTPHSTNLKPGERPSHEARALPTERPPGFCPAHPHGADGPCGPCGTAKRVRAEWDEHDRRRRSIETSEQAKADAAARRIAVNNCTLCDNRGYLNMPNGETGGLCDHTTRDTATRLAEARRLAGLNQQPNTDPADNQVEIPA